MAPRIIKQWKRIPTVIMWQPGLIVGQVVLVRVIFHCKLLEAEESIKSISLIWCQFNLLVRPLCTHFLIYRLSTRTPKPSPTLHSVTQYDHFVNWRYYRANKITLCCPQTVVMTANVLFPLPYATATSWDVKKVPACDKRKKPPDSWASFWAHLYYVGCHTSSLMWWPHTVHTVSVSPSTKSPSGLVSNICQYFFFVPFGILTMTFLCCFCFTQDIWTAFWIHFCTHFAMKTSSMPSRRCWADAPHYSTYRTITNKLLAMPEVPVSDYLQRIFDKEISKEISLKFFDYQIPKNLMIQFWEINFYCKKRE